MKDSVVLMLYLNPKLDNADLIHAIVRIESLQYLIDLSLEPEIYDVLKTARIGQLVLVDDNPEEPTYAVKLIT